MVPRPSPSTLLPKISTPRILSKALMGCKNAKISAVRSLADICSLYVLIRLITCIIVSVCVQIFKGC